MEKKKSISKNFTFVWDVRTTSAGKYEYHVGTKLQARILLYMLRGKKIRLLPAVLTESCEKFANRSTSKAFGAASVHFSNIEIRKRFSTAKRSYILVCT